MRSFSKSEPIGIDGRPLWVVSGRLRLYHPNGRFRVYSGHRMSEWGHKKTRHMAGSSVFLVAGARYANYMQIDIEPFPLVA